MKNRADFLASIFFLLTFTGITVVLNHKQMLIIGPQQFFVYYPLQHYWLSQLFSGNLPMINTAVADGIPIWADPNLAIFYPGNLLHLIFSFNTAWNLSLAFHLTWGPWGVYWLCRKTGLRGRESLIAAVVFLLSSPVLVSLNSNELIMAASWLPWIVGSTFFGLQKSLRETLLASIALSLQWLSGFTYIQAVTLLGVIVIAAVLYFRTKQEVVLKRFALMLAAMILLTAIQMYPALLWVPNSDFESFWSASNTGKLPYVGIVATIAALFALRHRFMWFAPAILLTDYVLFGGSPLFSFVFAIAVGFGVAQIRTRCRVAILTALLFAISLELVIANRNIPLLLSQKQITQTPDVIQEFPELKEWNIHQYGVRGTISPVAGLNWGLHYATMPRPGELMVWRPLMSRVAAIEETITGNQDVQLLSDARLGYVLSDVPFENRKLRLIRQNATKFYVYRLRIPVSPLVASSDPAAGVQWVEESPTRITVRHSSNVSSQLVIHRNAIPGWRFKMDGTHQTAQMDTHGWIKVDLPAGNHDLDFSYHVPGAVTGTLLTLLGTLLVIAAFRP